MKKIILYTICLLGVFCTSYMAYGDHDNSTQQAENFVSKIMGDNQKEELPAPSNSFVLPSSIVDISKSRLPSSFHPNLNGSSVRSTLPPLPVGAKIVLPPPPPAANLGQLPPPPPAANLGQLPPPPPAANLGQLPPLHTGVAAFPAGSLPGTLPPPPVGAKIGLPPLPGGLQPPPLPGGLVVAAPKPVVAENNDDLFKGSVIDAMSCFVDKAQFVKSREQMREMTPERQDILCTKTFIPYDASNSLTPDVKQKDKENIWKNALYILGIKKQDNSIWRLSSYLRPIIYVESLKLLVDLRGNVLHLCAQVIGTKKQLQKEYDVISDKSMDAVILAIFKDCEVYNKILTVIPNESSDKKNDNKLTVDDAIKALEAINSKIYNAITFSKQNSIVIFLSTAKYLTQMYSMNLRLIELVRLAPVYDKIKIENEKNINALFAKFWTAIKMLHYFSNLDAQKRKEAVNNIAVIRYLVGCHMLGRLVLNIEKLNDEQIHVLYRYADMHMIQSADSQDFIDNCSDGIASYFKADGKCEHGDFTETLVKLKEFNQLLKSCSHTSNQDLQFSACSNDSEAHLHRFIFAKPNGAPLDNVEIFFASERNFSRFVQLCCSHIANGINATIAMTKHQIICALFGITPKGTVPASTKNDTKDKNDITALNPELGIKDMPPQNAMLGISACAKEIKKGEYLRKATYEKFLQPIDVSIVLQNILDAQPLNECNKCIEAIKHHANIVSSGNLSLLSGNTKSDLIYTMTLSALCYEFLSTKDDKRPLVDLLKNSEQSRIKQFFSFFANIIKMYTCALENIINYKEEAIDKNLCEIDGVPVVALQEIYKKVNEQQSQVWYVYNYYKNNTSNYGYKDSKVMIDRLKELIDPFKEYAAILDGTSDKIIRDKVGIK